VSPTGLHLARRFAGALAARAPRPAEHARASALLSAPEALAWGRLSRADRRHSLTVLARLDRAEPAAPAEVRRAALLHDVGKGLVRLGVAGRVAATLLGSRTERWALYREHARTGAWLCRTLGTDAATLALLEGGGETRWREALRRADDA
jgi:hypothetical protein